MALTLPALRDRTTNRLEKEFELLGNLETDDTPNARVQQRTSKTKDRINELMNGYEQILQLSTTFEQREAYGGEEGAEKWNADFVMLRDLQLPKNSRFRTAEEFRNFVWSQVPAGKFRRFQEIFTGPEHKSVPRFTIDEKGEIKFHRFNNALNLKGCLVDADRIPDGLAEDLGLCDFEEDEGKPLERLKKKKESIPHLKKIFEAARPLQQDNYRLLIIEEPNTTVESSYPDVQKLDNAILGTLLYIREPESRPDANRKGAPRPPRKLSVQHFNDAYSALRKPSHVAERYREEVAEIATMSTALQVLNAKLDAQWTDETLRDELREEVASMSDRFVALFANVQNLYKVQAREFIEKFRELKDGRGRENPSAAMSQMIAAMTRLERRYRDMEPKSGFNERDAMVLRKQVQEHETQFDQYDPAVVASAKVTGNGIALFNTESKMTDDQISSNVDGIRKRIGIDPRKNLVRVTLQPFRTYREAMMKEYAGLENAFASRDRDAAIKQTIKLHVIGKYRRLRRSVERIKELTMNPMIPVTEIRSIVQEMKTVFATREVFPDTTAEEIEEAFVGMMHKINVVDTTLAKYEGQSLDVQQRAEMYGRLKTHLVDAFNVEELAMMSQ